jgi:hypothetical protein
MISNYWALDRMMIEYPGLIAFLTAILLKGNHHRNYKLWNIVSIERYIYWICRCYWNVAEYKW